MHFIKTGRFLLLVCALSFALKMSWSAAVDPVDDNLSERSDGSLSDWDDESIETPIDNDEFNKIAGTFLRGEIVSRKEAGLLSASSVTAAAGYECGCTPKACSATSNLTSTDVYALRKSFLCVPTQQSARVNAVALHLQASFTATATVLPSSSLPRKRKPCGSNL